MNRLIPINKIIQEISYSTGRSLKSPEFCSLIITNKCNFKCKMCSFWQKENSDELSVDDWRKIVNQLKTVLSKNTFIEISGGEPLLRKELVFDLIKELKKNFNKVALNTNGLLINEETVKELNDAGLDVLKLSLYSLNSTVHNELRGHEAAFEHAKKAIKIINQNGLELEIALLLTSKNIKQAQGLISYLQKLPKTSIIIQPLDEKVESSKSKDLAVNSIQSELWPESDDVNIFFDWLNKNSLSIKNSPANLKVIREYYLNPETVLKYRCFAGQRNLVIYPDGNVSFCFKRTPVGNLIKENLKEILSRAKLERLKIKKCSKYCRIVGCNFSRGFKEYIKK
jgi:MoaA/NifB/PqqE/SkfB family radical SAM enzyme